ncbi:MAG: single-stranded-DNA-specific exonuclease RecJ [Candidatus Parcubacteria bacterium]|nr:single-stranded-DNA-specific exonuclease RecJ [Candidatus Parcubacteria bacterium]
MAKQWVVRDKVSENLEEQLLHYRNIKLVLDYEKDLLDPFLMLDMDKAVERILRAIKNNERIIVFSDYDADGVCSASIFHDFFKKIGFENFHIHIPDRHLDGYGLTLESIDEFKKQEAKLIIALDCGITDYKEVERANKLEIDVIIIDHHLVPEKKIPRAFAIIDVKQKKDKYLFKDLCGAGVALKVIQAIIKRGEFNIVPGWEKWLLDLVAIATIADMVPLIDENRTLVFYGLQVLRKTKRPGFLSFYRRMEIAPANISEDDVSFTIAPRINVASRMEHANTSFELLTTESAEEADWLTGRIELLNKERKNIVEAILQEIYKKIDKASFPQIIVAGNLDWNAGVLGLLAMRLVEKYNRPVFLWGKGEKAKNIKGSCRSDGTIDLVELMKFLPEDIIYDFGGHSFAGGFSVKEEKINDLEKEILKAHKKISKQKTENDILHIDREIKLDDINQNFYSIIEKFQPFGIGNPKPVFLFSDLEIKNIRKFGNGGIHLQLDFGNISAIGFFMGGPNKHPMSTKKTSDVDDLRPGQKIDLVATLEKSFFRNNLELRLRIIDIQLK